MARRTLDRAETPRGRVALRGPSLGILYRSGEFGVGRPSGAIIKTGGEAVSLRGSGRHVGTVAVTSVRPVRTPPPMSVEWAGADSIGL